MKRILKLKGRTGLFDTPSFLLSANEELIIKCDFADEIRVGKFRLIVKHGEKKKTFSLSKSDCVVLSPDWLNENAENLEFSLVLLNTVENAVIKDDYQIEPLKIETVNGNFSYTAVLQEIIRRQDEQDKKMQELEERLNEYDDNGVPVPVEN